MKKIYLLAACFAIAHWANAQQKMEFGLVAKAGNFTLPKEKTSVVQYNPDESQSVSSNQPGSAYFFGIWNSLRLGGHFRLSAELLYRHITTHEQQYTFYRHGIGPDVSESEYWEVHQTAENSIFLPLKLHFSFKKNSRTSFALGAGFSKTFGMTYRGYNKSRNSNTSQFDFGHDTRLDLGLQDMSSAYLSFTTGAYHRLDARTTLGLEFNFERRDDPVRIRYAPSFSSATVDCLCYYAPSQASAMRNFSLSLSHSLAGIR
jgi:hypothetical protein